MCSISESYANGVFNNTYANLPAFKIIGDNLRAFWALEYYIDGLDPDSMTLDFTFENKHYTNTMTPIVKY